jgi:uncharacterized membrane protein YgcG
MAKGPATGALKNCQKKKKRVCSRELEEEKPTEVYVVTIDKLGDLKP